MKKLIMICMLVALISSHAVAQLGGWFKWSNQNYVPTSKDYSEIVWGINNNLIKPGEWYNFSSGDKYQVLHPVEWRDLIFKIYFKDDESVTLENLPEKISSSDDSYWGDDFSSKTNNYYWSQSGSIKFVQNYNGQKEKVPISVKNGKIMLKRNCGNPQEEVEFVPTIPRVTQSLFVPTPAQMEVHASGDINFHHQMDTMYVVHLIKNQLEQPLQTPTENIFTPDKQKTWFGKNWPYLVGGAFFVGGGAGFIFHGDGVWYGLGGSHQMVIEPRTMPPGLDSNTSNGGLNSDPRNMGGGISSFAPKNYTPKTLGFGVNFSF